MGPRADAEQTHHLRSWFSGAMSSSRSQSDRSYSWFCRATFEPKSEAVREIKWSKFQDDGKLWTVFSYLDWCGHLFSPTHTR